MVAAKFFTPRHDRRPISSNNKNDILLFKIRLQILCEERSQLLKISFKLASLISKASSTVSSTGTAFSRRPNCVEFNIVIGAKLNDDHAT